MEKEIKEIQFGAKDSELYKFEYTIPEGYEARIENGKVIVKKKESEDERILEAMIFRLGELSEMWFENIFCKQFTKAQILAYLEKQKEQKPQEQRVDVIKMSTLLAADRLASAEMTGRFKERKEILENPEKYGLCKPAEWSEEDENIRQSLINDLENAETEDEDVQKELNEKVAWLKSLLPQPKQKNNDDYITPSKKFFQWIYDRLVYVHKENPDIDYMRSFKERIENLSFDETPHWKPNEEQMKALNEIINTLAVSKHPHENDYLFNILNGLRKNLKSL